MLELFEVYTARIAAAAVPYMVTGAGAAIIYGEPRMTADLDLVVDVAIADLPGLLAQFNANEFYVPPLEVLEQEVVRESHGHANLLHHDSGLRADLYFVGRDPLSMWGMARRVEAQGTHGPFWIAPIEYVIVRKLQYWRDGESQRQRRDVEGMVRTSGARIDRDTLERLATASGVADQWTTIVNDCGF